MRNKTKKIEKIIAKYSNLMWGSLSLFTRRSSIVLTGLIETLSELFLLFVMIILIGGMGYTLSEGTALSEGIWWATLTTFTIGYNDIYPESLVGGLIGSALMTISIFVIVPLITARLVVKLMSHDRKIEAIYKQVTSDKPKKERKT